MKHSGIAWQKVKEQHVKFKEHISSFMCSPRCVRITTVDSVSLSKILWIVSFGMTLIWSETEHVVASLNMNFIYSQYQWTGCEGTYDLFYLKAKISLKSVIFLSKGLKNHFFFQIPVYRFFFGFVSSDPATILSEHPYMSHFSSTISMESLVKKYYLSFMLNQYQNCWTLCKFIGYVTLVTLHWLRYFGYVGLIVGEKCTE